MGPPTRLQDLVDLARETSSVRRRELLRRVTDLFLAADAPARPPAELRLFDGVLTALASELETEVRAELAERFAQARTAPAMLVGRMARDEIGIARPILANPRLLSEGDLLDVVRTQGQEHLRVVSGRDGLSVAVSDAIVERGDDATLDVLVRNPTAALSRHAAEQVVDRASVNSDLHDAVVSRRDLPIDLLNEMYFVVEGRLRTAILDRNAGVDPAVLEAALAAGRNRLAARDGMLPPDYAEAEADIARQSRRGRMAAAALVPYLRASRRTHFLLGLANLTEMDFATLAKIVERRELDALAIICKAAEVDRALFLTFAVMISDARDAMGQAETYGRLYAELPADTAQRTIRFWRVRREAGETAAAA